MVDKDISMESEGEEYELLPHKEIEELKEELRKLKEFEITPTKKLKVSLLELNKKLDRLLKIFDEAQHTIKTEEMGLNFKERMRPVLDKMDKILEQNADLAEGIVALADMMREGKGPEVEEEGLGVEEASIGPTPPMPIPGAPAPGIPPPGAPRPPMPGPSVRPPMPRAPPAPGIPPPAPPRRKRTFGII